MTERYPFKTLRGREKLVVVFWLWCISVPVLLMALGVPATDVAARRWPALVLLILFLPVRTHSVLVSMPTPN